MTTAGTVVELPVSSVVGRAVVAITMSVEPKDMGGSAADPATLVGGELPVALTPGLAGLSSTGTLTEEVSLLGAFTLTLAGALLSGRFVVGLSWGVSLAGILVAGSSAVGLLIDIRGCALEASVSGLDTTAVVDGAESESAGTVLLALTDDLDGLAAIELDLKREPIAPPTLSASELERIALEVVALLAA